MTTKKRTKKAVEEAAENVAEVDESMEETGEHMEGLTEGRIVHYVKANGEHRAAIILKVWANKSGCSNLRIFTDDEALSDGWPDVYRVTSVLYDADGSRPNTWHWIERA